MATRQKRVKRIGIFGGTFNPIHYGHLMCAEWTRQQFKLDRLLFVTSSTPPNKNDTLDAEKRHDMVVATVAENPSFEASRLDLEHKGTGYTLLTIEAARREFGPDVELFYLTSSEYLDPTHKYHLPKWVGFKELAPLCTFLVFPRESTEIDQVKAWAKLVPQAKIEVLYVPSPELSSTLVRERVQKGLSIRYMTPFVVQQMIAKGNFYQQRGTQASDQDACSCQLPKEIKHLAIYGSQFDPIHYGHLIGAEWARQQYGIDRVLFVTSANPPNNKSAALSAEDRHAMVVAAVSDNPYFEASRLDLDRGTTSYAILTVEQVRQQYGEGVELSMFVSSEYLDPAHPFNLATWMGASKLFGMVRFLVFPTDRANFEQAKEWAKLIPDARIEVMPAPALPVTSSLIREMVGKGQSIWYTTPWPVQQTIAKKGLYKKTRKRKTATR